MLKPMKACRAIFVATLVATMGLGGAACTNGGKKTDETGDKAKEEMKDALVEALGTPREALDAFDQANVAMDKEVPDLAQAQTLLEKALGMAPDFQEAQFNLGVIHEANGRYADALTAYGKAQTLDKLNTHSVKIILAMGRAHSLAGNSDESIKLFEEAQRLDPENIAVLNALATAYYKAGKHEDAIEHVTRVLRSKNEDLTALNTLAQVYTAQDNRSMAVYVFKKAARVAIGAIKEEQLSIEPAQIVLSEEFEAKDTDASLSADIFNNLGMIYLKMDELPLAVYNFNSAAKLSPSHVESRLNIGAIYLRYLNYKGAKDMFSAALTAAPGNCVAKLGVSASDFAMGEHDASLTGYMGYLESCNDKDTSAILQIQRLYERKQEFEKAIPFCEKYVSLSGAKEGDPVTADYCKALKQMGDQMRDQPMGPEGGGDMPPEGGEIPPEGGEIPAEGGEIPAEGGEMVPLDGEEGGDTIPAEGEEGGDTIPPEEVE